MIRVLIEGQDIILSDDFSTDLIRENALLTKAGDYTYDIDVDLRIPANKKIYKHINRLHSASHPTDRTAEIWSDNRLLVRGTESILQVKGDIVKIQVLANNSAVNYSFDDSTKVRSMDFGTCTSRQSTAAAKALLNKGYGDAGACECYPVIYCGGHFYNYWSSLGEHTYSYKDKDTLRPMPFVLYFLDKLMELLGYTIRTDHINRQKYKWLCLIHGYNTDEYAKMLPNWTVGEMLEEFEMFFNVVFYFDSINKQVDIVSVDAFYSAIGTEIVDAADVLDEHETEYKESDDDAHVSYKNVGYKLPGDEYWKFQNIPEDIYDMCTIEQRIIDPSHEYEPTDMAIYYDPAKECEWLHYEGEEGGEKVRRIMIVNVYRDNVEDKSVSKTELRIVPTCDITVTTLTPAEVFETFPYVTSTEIGSSNFCDVIRGSEDAVVDTMQVAFYLGLANYRISNTGYLGQLYNRVFPLAVANYWHQYANFVFTYDTHGITGAEALPHDYDRSWNLQLTGDNGRVSTELTNAVYIDTAVLKRIRFRTGKFLEPRKKFVIANRLFYCRQLKYSISKGCIDGIAEGEFYPAK